MRTDFLIIGAGIVGLAIARELKIRYPDAEITVLEKEPEVGRHASGRNSGVLHSGIYYPENSLKAKVCVEGARLLTAYCEEHGLPLHRYGKVIVPVKPTQDTQLDLLYRRGLANGARVEMIDEKQLRAIEPEAATASGHALFSPNTAVFDPQAILEHLVQSLTRQGIHILTNHQVSDIDPDTRRLRSNGQVFQYHHLFNTAGLHADRVARRCGIGQHYAMLPFKGLYYELDPQSPLRFNGLIYPVPDLNVPFLGVHFTKSAHGKIYAGPTAIPALGRENYRGLEKLDAAELPRLGFRLLRQYWLNYQGFRQYTHDEAFRFFKGNFVQAARALVPALKARDLKNSEKVGIRAQLLDLRNHQLVMDFLVETGPHSTHVLNAVSPAFTSAFAFACLVLDHRDVALREPVVAGPTSGE